MVRSPWEPCNDALPLSDTRCDVCPLSRPATDDGTCGDACCQDACVKQLLPGEAFDPHALAEPCFLTVRSGIVKVVCAGPTGRRVIASLRYPGDIIDYGLAPADGAAGDIIDYGLAPADGAAGGFIEFFLEAATPTQICAVPQSEAVLDGRISVRGMLRRLRQAAAQTAAAECRQAMLALSDPVARIACFLLELGSRPAHRVANPGGGGAQEIKLILRYYDIADYLGLAKETVSRCLGQMEHAGYLERTGRYQIRVYAHQSIRDLAGHGNDSHLQKTL